MVVFTDMGLEDIQILYGKGFVELKQKTIYELARLKKGSKKGETVLAILYTSGKLLLQGNEKLINQTANYFRGKAQNKSKEVKPQKFNKQIGRVIGSDESLKGDSFGGITIAAVKADDKIRLQLKEIGVADSKTLDDKEILQMAIKIRKVAPCTVINVYPHEYNDKVNPSENKHNNVTALLNNLHHQSAKDLSPGYHIVDKYPGCIVGDLQETKAESKYVEVAAASILARAAAVDQLNHLSKLAGFQIPKGSTHVAWAFKELKERNLNPKEFVKLHFKNVQKALDL
ncbi:hypothetical protein HOC01_05145 [archaeon]|jgi:ribonuclease HIII|nr:hypothetical protein [archaeon]MBT6698196.1 hypothetical protein [archaeon]